MAMTSEQHYYNQIKFLILDLIKPYNFIEDELKISTTGKTSYFLNFLISTNIMKLPLPFPWNTKNVSSDITSASSS